MKLSQISIRNWILENAIKTENGKDLDFHTHRYLRDIYTDTSPYLVCLKAGQIGFSTMAILKTIWLAKNRHLNIGYILPTVEMVQKFVGSKVNPIAQQNPIVSQWMKDKDAITIKQIGDNFIHYLGSQTDLSAIMLSLDLLVGDEFDKSPQSILETYDSRLQHSEYGWKWLFSNPTIPDFGVDRFWNESDKKTWHITHSCGENFIMDETCIDYKREIFACPKCTEEITDEERRMGEWIKTSEGKWSGYWIPLWINPMIKAEYIAEKKKGSQEYFYNFVAGLPYVNPNDALTEKALKNCLSNEVNTQEGRVIIGLDTSYNLHYTLMNKQGVFFHGYCASPQEKKDPNYDPYDEIDKLLYENKNWILLADQGGDLIGVRKLQQKYIGRVFLIWSVKETRNKTLIRWGEDEEYGKVLIDRNRVIQLAVDQINEKRMVFNGTQEDWQLFFNHALNIYRVKNFVGEENDPQYGWKWEWKRKGPDHWFMSMVYALVGMDKYAESLAEIIKKRSSFGVKGTNVDGGTTGGRFIRGDVVKW